MGWTVHEFSFLLVDFPFLLVVYMESPREGKETPVQRLLDVKIRESAGFLSRQATTPVTKA